jgi:hypothetical protein
LRTQMLDHDDSRAEEGEIESRPSSSGGGGLWPAAAIDAARSHTKVAN